MDKIFHGREQHMKAYSNAVEKLERDISEAKAMVNQVYEDGLRRSAEIVANAIKKYENALDTQLKFMRAENEARANAARNRIRKEIDGLESIFKMQVEITAQTAFERLFTER
jgi:F0F1-type ATP synthase membrane subunit b/b'